MMESRKNPSVVIIGAGMTGILLVIKLREAGITNITLLEKAKTIGGTWRENSYPGVACDVPSHAYTYSFEPNPDWSSFFASGSEIYHYFKRVYHKYGVDACTRLNEGVISCVYRDEKWLVKSTQGNTYTADLLFSATGILHKPVMPEILGLNSFKGALMHSARWDHNVALNGKRIGIIGTGSSAAQIIPELIKLPGTDVTVFQRTAQWIIHTDNKIYTEADKKRFREKPFRSQLIRRLSLFIFEQGTTALTGDNWLNKMTHRLYAWNALRNLKKCVKDPELRAQLTPHYTFGCKRVVMNGTFYDAIQQPNAHLITDGIQSIEVNGVITKDGKLHELDVLVCATGFDPIAYMRPMEFLGRNGVAIEEAWQKKIQAYRSICVPQFPNFFLMLGPNSPIGNYSVIAMSEIQSDYIIQLIRYWQAGDLPTIEPKPEALQTWAAMLRAKMKKTVWASGCQSWYLDADGDPLTWPDKWKNWVSLMKQVNLNDFVIRANAAEPPADRKAAATKTASKVKSPQTAASV